MCTRSARVVYSGLFLKKSLCLLTSQQFASEALALISLVTDGVKFIGYEAEI